MCGSCFSCWHLQKPFQKLGRWCLFWKKNMWHIQSLKVLFKKFNFYNFLKSPPTSNSTLPWRFFGSEIINESSTWLQVTASFTLPKAQWEKSCSARYSPQDLWIKMHPKSVISQFVMFLWWYQKSWGWRDNPLTWLWWSDSSFSIDGALILVV